MISIMVLIFSCRRDTNMGHSLLTDDELLDVNQIDTFTIEAYTESIDTTYTVGITSVALGDYNDEIFGYTKAGFACQILNILDFRFFEAGDQIDSVVMIMPFSADTSDVLFYGDTLADQTIRVYRLNEDLENNVLYKADHDASSFKTGDLLAEYTFKPEPNARKKDPNKGYVRIPVDISLADDFLNLDDSVYVDQADFKDFFKGIYVEAEATSTNGSALIKYDISQEFTISFYGLDLDETDTTLQKKVWRLTPDYETNVRFNLFDHDYTGAPVENSIDQMNVQDSVVFLQGGNGLRTRIKIPHLDKLKESGNVIIHRAELILTEENKALSYADKYKAISELQIVFLYNDIKFLLPDYDFGTSYLSIPHENGGYKFDITQYVQFIVDEKLPNEGLIVYPAATINSVNFYFGGAEHFKRTVLTSGNHSNPMKFIITYGIY
jgi:hypothetical protein